ncbi:MAG: cytochrome C oxidase subunit II [Pseudomonadales bacterium]|nr:cytochrome C oxidase subunit II [Pseudomonadales bacterium]MBL6813739.1 cytochrome C oxidase subunit II [Pseudomonadales bacterium]
MIQGAVFLVSAILMLVVAATFIFVALNASKKAVAYPPLLEKSYSMRAKFFWVLSIAGILILVVTTLDLPYAATRGDVPGNAKLVDVDGRQWFWNISQTEFEKGDVVVFSVTASDVTHGLGIYGPNLRMLNQTQAMPGYSNALEVTFGEPGEYKLMCMEYCGLAHHAMVTAVTVSE